MNLAANWSVPLAAPAAAAPLNGLITGEIERLTLNNAADPWSGGKIVVGGQSVIIPRNLLIDLPANRLSLTQFFQQAPATCATIGESGVALADTCNVDKRGGIAAIAANRTNGGDVIAGDVYFQKGAELVDGQITYINYTDGYFRLNGNLNDPLTGTMVRLNDPTGRHTVQQGLGCVGGPNCSADPRFTLDPDNYTSTFATGYPVCLPSTVARTFTDSLGVGTTTAQSAADGGGDVLCPSANRTPSLVAGDSRRFAPIQMGDWVSVKGNFEHLSGVTFLSAWSTQVSGALTTNGQPGQPDYMFVQGESSFVGAPGYQLAPPLGRVKDQMLGVTTNPRSDVVFYTVQHDPVTNAVHEFPHSTSVGCDTFNGLNSCTLVGGLPNTFRIRHEIIFGKATVVNGPASKGDPCKELQADPRFGAAYCPLGGTPEEEFGIEAPISREMHGYTGLKLADLTRVGGPILKTVDIQGNAATNGQYLLPMGIGLGGIDIPNPLEFNLSALGSPYEFDGLTWAMDRRLSPNGCPSGCEATPQPLDPFPFPGLDPRTQVPLPTGTYNDPNFTATPLTSVANRVLSYVDAKTGKFNGDLTILTWPAADPPAQVVTVTPPLNNLRAAPPAVPINLTATANGTSRIDLSWFETDPAAIGYRVFRDGSTTALAAITGGATTTFSDTTLAPASTHSYTVAAFDAAGNQSAQSAAASATTVTPPFQADLALSGAASPDPVTANGSLTYTLTVLNNGPQPATNVVLNDTLPAGVPANSTSSSQGTCTAAPAGVNCSLGSLANGASATVTIGVSPTAAGSITNRASVSATEFDPNTANNSLTQQTTVNAPPAAASADLSITHSPNPPNRARPGATFTYTLNVANAGPQAATNVVVTDALSPEMVYQGATPTQGTCGNSLAVGTAGGRVTCNLGSVPAGQSVPVVFTILTPALGTATDTATVVATESDPNPANNTQTQSNRIH